jgi:hypothetical protein
VYDSYTSVTGAIAARLAAAVTVADSNGHANVLHYYLAGYPSQKSQALLGDGVIKKCKGCTLISKSLDAAKYFDPTALQAQVTADLRVNPKVNYIFLDLDSSPLSAVTAALASLGRKDVKMVSENSNAAGIALVKSGALFADAGQPIDWIAMAEFDNLRRTLAHQPYMWDTWGGGDVLFTKANLPKTSGAITDEMIAQAWDSKVHYRAAYEKLWHLKSGSIKPGK